MQGPMHLESGAALQGGLSPDAFQPGKAGGRLLRGVVVATYVSDSPQHPFKTTQGNPCAVYCDVLCYSSLASAMPALMPMALVSQERASIQSGDIWLPRAARQDTSGRALSLANSNPMDLDGDHVLVGFMEDKLTNPVILRSLPHPRSDQGQAAAEPALGQRMRLRQVDGSPSLRKHHGSVLGLSDSGDFIVRTTYANAGGLGTNGSPPGPPADDSVGNILAQLHSRAKRLVQWFDMDDPATPREVMREQVTQALFEVQFLQASAHLLVSDASGRTIEATGGGAAATLQVGTATSSVAIADQMQILYSAFADLFSAHTHVSATPGSPTSPPVSPAPAWMPSIASSHLKIPPG